MLTLYRRHAPPCTHTSRQKKNCKCAIWVQGSLGGEYLRKSLDFRSWEAASDLVRGWEASGELGVVKVEIPGLEGAVTLYLTDCKARHLSDETLRKYTTLLVGRLIPWTRAKGYTRLKQLSVEVVREYGSHALACGARVGAGSVDTPAAEIVGFDGGSVDTSVEMAAFASPSLGRPRPRTGTWAARRYRVTVARSTRTVAAMRLTGHPR